MECGFQYKGLITGEDRGGDVSLLTGLEEAVPEFETILRQRDEEAVRRLNAMRRNFSEDPVLRDAPWLRPEAPERKSPFSMRREGIPLRDRSLRIPTPVAPPPMTTTSA
jgi:hypothetical protein